MDGRLLLMVVLYAGFSIMSPMLSAKVLWGVIPAGMLTGCIAYGLVDVINNAGGKEVAAQTVDAAVVARAVLYLMVFAIAMLPPASPFPTSVRVFLAATFGSWVAMRAFAIPVFDGLRRRLRFGFWARYNLTNLPAQVLALVIWVPLAYYGSGVDVLAVVAGGLLVRVALAVAMTPVFSWLARWATVAALVVGAAQARAVDIGPVQLQSTFRVLASTGAFPARVEIIPSLRWDALWLHDLFIWDIGSARSILNNKLTAGYEIGGGASVISQVQSVTGQATVFRAGLEWRLK